MAKKLIPELPEWARKELQELYHRMSGSMMAMRMWRQLMTDKDRRTSLKMVNQEPHDPELDDNPKFENYTLAQEMKEGVPGKVLHRCYYRWGAVGIWMKARNLAQPNAIVDLAYQYGLLNEAARRRLLLALGDVKSGSSSCRPNWNHETGELHFSGKRVRRVGYPGRATNVVAILDAFEEQGWPNRIDDPLPGGTDKQRLREAVRNLNRELTRIRFRADGSGTGIVWQTTHTRATPARRH